MVFFRLEEKKKTGATKEKLHKKEKRKGKEGRF